MSQQKVNLGRQGFVTRAYKNAIDTSFSQLIPPPPPIEKTITVSEFFNLYKKLFYEIPINGNVNSHAFLIEQSIEYVGVGGNPKKEEQNIEILLDEISLLRKELLQSQRDLLNFQTSTGIVENGGGEDELIAEFERQLTENTPTSPLTPGSNVTEGVDSSGNPISTPNGK